MHASMAETLAFLRAWRLSASRACRHQYGILLAVPVVWACLDAYALPGTAALGFLAMALFLERRPGPRLACQALIFLLASAWLGDRTLRPEGEAAMEAEAGKAGTTRGKERLQGRVQGFPTGQGRMAFVLVSEAGRLRVTAREADFTVRPGQSLELVGKRERPGRPTNPGQFDQAAFLRSQGLAGLFRADSLRLLEPPGPFDRFVAGIRDALGRALERTVPASRIPLFEAALLGNTSGLDPAVMDDFRASGMLHILAISGQHIGLLALILLQVFSLLRLPRKAAFVMTGLLVGLYVPVCGSSISVIRSAVMFWSMLPAVLWERPARGLNNLALAACACLLWMPYQILNLGFQLSFGATYFLLLYSRPISRGLAGLSLPGPWRAFAGYAWSNTALSAVIFLGLLPLLSATVHAVSPTSIAGNLATVGLSSAMLTAGCLALMASPLPLLGPCLGESAGLLAALLALVVKGLARLPGSCMPAESLPIGWALLLLFLLLAFPYALSRGRGRALVLLGLLAFSGRWAAGEAWDLWRRPAAVAFLDVGQGDAALLRLPGADILIDAGPPEAGREAVLPYLRAAGIGRLDLVVITHPDLDHYGGMAWLAGRIPIGAVIGNGDSADTRAWNGLRAALAERGVPWRDAGAGQSLYRYGEISLEVIAPEAGARHRERNDNSLVCLLRLPRGRVLFTGDMGRAAQARLLARGQDGLEGMKGLGGPEGLRGAILKVPHHGSDRTTDLAFLAALRPRAAIISAGRRNRFGHPGRGNLETLRRAGARLFLTTEHGAILYQEDRRGAAWDTFLPAGAPDRNM